MQNKTQEALESLQYRTQNLIEKASHINQKLGAGRIIIISALFNQDIVAAQQAHAQRFFQAVGYEVPIYTTAGSLELPWLAQDVYLKHKPSVILALGTIIKGESYHFEMVCQQSLAGLMQVSLQCHVPIIQGVLTTYTIAQAQKRVELAYEQAMQAYETSYSLVC